MGLTFRQKALLAEFIDFFEEEQEPIHYIAVAKRLGLSNATAYEMLRKLEQTGAVERVYALSEDPGKRGRARILFMPGKKTIDVVHQLEKEGPNGKDWNEIKFEIIQRVETGNKIYPEDYDELQVFLDKVFDQENLHKKLEASEQLEELKDYILTKTQHYKSYKSRKVIKDLIGMLTFENSPVLRCAQIIAVLSISIQDHLSHIPEKNMQEYLEVVTEVSGDQEGLGMLVGMFLGAHFSGRTELIDSKYYRKCAQLYISSLKQLKTDEIATLQRFTHSLWGVLFQNSSDNKKLLSRQIDKSSN